MKILPTEKEKRLFNYIATLEDVNHQLILALKKCVDVLAQFKGLVPHPHSWQEMLGLFEATIKEGQRVAHDRTLH